VNGKFYVIGGFRGSVMAPLVDDSTAAVDMFDPAAKRWETRKNMLRPRMNHSVAVLGSRIFVFGGQAGSAVDSALYDVVDVYEPVNDSWTTWASHMPRYRSGAGLAVVDGIVFLIGGFNRAEGLLASVEQFDAMRDIWAEREPLGVARSGVCAFATGQTIQAFGGEGGSGSLSIAETYNPTLGPSIFFSLRNVDVPDATVTIDSIRQFRLGASNNRVLEVSGSHHDLQTAASGLVSRTITATGVIGFQEEYPKLALVPPETASTDIDVPPTAVKDTGKDIAVGEELSISASGSWGTDRFQSNNLGPDGLITCRGGGNHVLPGAPCGALVGRIGNGPWFYIGPAYFAGASTSGRLFLSINDDRGSYGDNVGQPLRVTISVLPPLSTLQIEQIMPFNGIATSQAQLAARNSNSTYPMAIRGRIALAFEPNAVNLADDPATRFVDGPGGLNGSRTMEYIVPAKTTTMLFGGNRSSVLTIQTGTVAGTITFPSSVQDIVPSSIFGERLVIARSAPVIKSAAASVSRQDPQVFETVIQAYSSPRDLSKVTLRVTWKSGLFSDAMADLTDDATIWFRNPQSAAYGSEFLLRFPVRINNGSFDSIRSITVTLTNSVGPSESTTASLP
jgi:hypothetical protein